MTRMATADQTLNTFLEQTTAAHASRLALQHRPGGHPAVWTYQDLRQSVNRIAHWLQSTGVGKGDRVVIWAPNGPWWVACFFAVLRNGSTVVPLDIRSSPEFVERVITQTQPQLGIVGAGLARSWRFAIPVFTLEALESLLPPDGPSRLPDVSPDDVAEIVFTSGTTGAPKGAMLTHRNTWSNVAALNQLVPSNPRLRALSILPLSHLFEQTCGLLLPLLGGAAIAYVDVLQPAAIQRAMAEYRVTTMVLVPRVLSLFMDSIENKAQREGKARTWQRACRLAEHLPMQARRVLFRQVIQGLGGRLEFLVAGGAPLAPSLQHKWELLGIPVLQGYGATETSPIITGTSVKDRRTGSVGKALPGTDLQVTDDGEILVRGPQVMQGYWQNPGATAEVLGDGWYQTGDLGELDAEGRLYLKGRKKDLIVLANGLKVYPEDVEDALRDVPGVVDAVVLDVPSASGPQIHAVLLCEPDPHPALPTWCAQPTQASRLTSASARGRSGWSRISRARIRSRSSAERSPKWS